MKPIGLLMREHRLIERMIGLMNQRLQRIRESKDIGPFFINTATDFLQIYADRTHHGKEEDILFRDLASRRLAPEHKRTMDELVQEHMVARKTTRELVQAYEAYSTGDIGSLKDIVRCLDVLVTLYPAHIEKEDKHFFFPSMEYLNQTEHADMLQKFWEFDRQMIHEKYQATVTEAEKMINYQHGAQ